MALFKAVVYFRGTTIIFLVTFTDVNGNVVTPVSPALNINFSSPNGQQTQTIAMQAPGNPVSATQWLAEWDSRGANPGQVYYSINSGEPVPAIVADGNFQLNANPANPISF